MRPAFIALFFFCVSACYGQSFNFQQVKLPAEISYYDNQFSGLYIHDAKLYLMSESRLQDNREAVLYSIRLNDLEHNRADSNFILPYTKIPVRGLDILREKMRLQQQEYEGLEAIVINGNDIYLSVETNTPSPYCYLLKGRLENDIAVMDTGMLRPVRKPTKPNGEHIYNAGFEAMALYKDMLYCYFEYNYFDGANYAYRFDAGLNPVDSIKLTPALPFRITDITRRRKNHFTAINYFYKGGGDDEVYRLPPGDANNTLIKKDSIYQNYIRLIDVKIGRKKTSWKTLAALPVSLMSYNWEGIAVYKNGYYIINDKYTPAKPYSSVLLYIER